MSQRPGAPAGPTASSVTLPLTVRDLLPADLPSCGWAGTPLHLANVARQLDRARRGEVDYLAVCTPSGAPVAKCGIDYRVREGAGTLWQLAVLPALQSCGIGGLLVSAAERRIVGRGLSRAELSVEEDNPRARALYERLGYTAYGQETESWDQQGPDGVVRRHEAVCTLMRKELERPL
ncbi:GNAT family N-acetyltransferase [Streptomyces piniterrae]|uniref:GNAT family N-acetyltransferase n=1 Tax=Streptomyces piniterrae TaxID=2571125 RepID=A0A4U0NAT1_9ACTN|nr:GNAT family N-acetyltransferase [Streptomyces piniterrae]TJZ51031.1 GNAT family N-acetyltransferase [Streptomyces piniterrae]